MNILFTICGRAGSKGIKNKNIKNFLEYPLPYYTISVIDLYIKKYGKNCNYDIVVNTDSQELINLVLNNQMQEIAIIERDKNLSGDSIGKISVIQDCLIQMQRKTQEKYDVVVDLDITSPLRTLDDLYNLIDVHVKTNADVTTTVTTARRNPYFNQVMKVEKGYKRVIESKFTARQQAPTIYDMNASLYAYKPQYLMTGKGVLEGYCECIQMYDTGILDLDHENDFELMEVIAKYLFTKNKLFNQIYDNLKLMK